jgi:hypothetical protein
MIHKGETINEKTQVSIALHPSGLYILVGFNDSLKLMNLLIDDIRPYWSANVRGCREVRTYQRLIPVSL